MNYTDWKTKSSVHVASIFEDRPNLNDSYSWVGMRYIEYLLNGMLERDTYIYIYIYLYRDVFFRQRPPVAPQATGGPLKKRWPPHKMVAPSNIDMKHRWNEIESILVKMKHKNLLKHYETPKTENSRSRQYIAKNMHEKTNFDVRFLQNGSKCFHNIFPA